MLEVFRIAYKFILGVSGDDQGLEPWCCKMLQPGDILQESLDKKKDDN
jgi:hypothetical protein